MNINIYINEKKLSSDSIAAINEYIKRLSPFANMKILTNEAVPRDDHSRNTKNYMLRTASDGKTGCHTISSPELAELINRLNSNGISRINYFIGYKDSLPDDTDAFAISYMRLSNAVLATALAEQIYRAYTINHGITYHK